MSESHNKPCHIEESPARTVAETFVNAVSTAYLRCDRDFVKFCELLGLKADEYGQEKWLLFNQSIKLLNKFDLLTLTQIVELGLPRAESSVPIQPKALVEPPLEASSAPESSNDISP